MAKRWKTCVDLRANLISTKVSASHRKSTQVYASPGQTKSQVDPSIQLASPFGQGFTVGLKCNFRKITARFSAGRRKQLVVSDMLLFWCSWLKYWFIKLNLVTVGKFYYNFSRVLVAQLIASMSTPARACLNHCLRDAQNVCALTKVDTVLKVAHYSFSETW